MLATAASSTPASAASTTASIRNCSRTSRSSAPIASRTPISRVHSAGVLSPILHVVPLQLPAYDTVCAHGTDVDKPRNLAKSVTVE